MYICMWASLRLGDWTNSSTTDDRLSWSFIEEPFIYLFGSWASLLIMLAEAEKMIVLF